MFATKKDAVSWISYFGGDLQLEPRKQGAYWRIYDADGFALTDERIANIEDAVHS